MAETCRPEVIEKEEEADDHEEGEAVLPEPPPGKHLPASAQAQARQPDCRECPALRAVEDRLTAIGETLKTLQQQQANLGDQRRVIAEMHDQSRKLTEQFHEREVLGPLFFTVIGILDRHRQETGKVERSLTKHLSSRNWRGTAALGHILDARTADRLEMENLLANLGVEPFEHPGPQFEPRLQKCVARVACDDPARQHHVAQRLQPGYRRNGKILRQELVTVYVANGHNRPQ